MEKIKFDDIEALRARITGEYGPFGEAVEVSQEMIDGFAELTGDHQWIHVDVERCVRESPFGTTIAHGFLTLSMVVHLGSSIPPVDPEAYQGVVMGVNYGLDKVRFPNPVKVDSKIRARRQLLSAELKNPTTIQIKQLVTVEIEGEQKPGCAAEQLSRLIYT